MNPADFQTMAAPNGGPTGGGQGGVHAIQAQIFKTLQQQPVPQGWQTTVSVPERGGKVFQLVSSLRLIKPNMNPQEAISVARNFESKAFQDAPDKASYETQCKEKLAQIRDTRARQTAKMQQQAQNVQSGMVQQASMQGMMPKQNSNQPQQSFPNPQLQHPMQASPIPPQMPQQQQIAMGMPLANAQASGQMTQQMQSSLQRHGPPPTGPEDNVFTAQENQQINILAQRLVQTIPRADLEKRANLQNLTPEQRQQLARQNIDPFNYFLRREAVRQFRINKAKMQAQLAGSQQNVGVMSRAGPLPPGVAVMPQQARPRSQNAVSGQAQQLAVMNPNHGFDPSLAGNINQIIGQQAEALRSQDAGQLVVPASNNPGMTQQPLPGAIGVKQPQTSQNAGIAGNTRPMAPASIAQSSQQIMGAQQARYENMQQAAQGQAQSQAHARAIAHAKAQQIALQGQPDGMNPHISQIPPSQSPAMPNTNRALGPAGHQSHSQTAPQHQKRFPQGVQQPGPQGQQDAPQSRSSMTPQFQTNKQAQRPPIPPNMPPSIQQQIANLPEDQMRALIARWQNQPRNAQGQPIGGRPPMPQTPAPMQNQMSQAGMQFLVQGMPPAQVMNHQMLGTPNANFPPRPPSTQQHAAKGTMSHPEMQQRAQQAQQHQQQQQQQQREAQRRQEIQRRHAMQSLPPDKAQEMDDMDFPTGIFNAHNNTISQVPPNVRTWGHLKSWVAQNPHIMPTGSLDKLKDLQYLHYSNLSNPNQRRVTAPQAGQAFSVQMAPSSMAPNYGLGVAPAAPMVPQGPQNGQVPLQRPNPQPFQTPNGMPPLQAPTPQDVQAARMRLPDQWKGANDDQVRTLILRTRYKQAMSQFPNAMKGPHPMQAQSQQTTGSRAQQQEGPQQPAQQPPGQVQQTRKQPNQASPNTRVLQEQHLQRARQPMNMPDNRTGGDQTGAKAAKPAPQGRVGVVPPPQVAQDPKGVKRPSYDDVVEVPNPNLQHTQAAQQARSEQTQPERRPPTFNPSAEQMASMTPKQRAMLEARMREQAQKPKFASLSNVNQPGQVSGAENQLEIERQKDFDRKDARLKQIVQEVLQSSPKRQPIDMSPEVRAMMAQKLRDAKDMVHRMEQSLPMVFRMFADETSTRELISTRLLLVQQYQGTEYNPVDRFTISPEELDASISKLRKYFNFVMRSIKARQPQHSQPQPPQQPPHAQMHPLNAENLQQQQQALEMARKASLQKHHNARDSRPPAAPTSSQPPFPIGAASPHGVPQAYGPNELTQEKLKFPPAKKQKKNQQGSAASTPAQGFGTPGSTASPQLTKLASPEMQRQAGVKVNVEAPVFRCPIGSCEYNTKGFTSQMGLDRHTTEAHETKEPVIEDPLSWALESLAQGLGLDSNGKRRTPARDPSTTKQAGGAPNMKATPSKQGETPKLKQEISTPVTRTTTPMGRPPTQSGPSPASSLLKTPQTTNTRTPGAGASTTKTLATRSSKGDDMRMPAENVRTSVQQSPTPPDPWADSSIRPQDLLQCFDGIDTLQVIGPFSHMQASMTPASTQSGSSRSDKKDSPRESDISENDQLQINIASGDDAVWNPFGLYNGLTGDLEELRFGEDLLTMDWESSVEKSDKATTVKGDGSEQWAASPAWDPKFFSMS